LYIQALDLVDHFVFGNFVVNVALKDDLSGIGNDQTFET
jgi:hypothetical protein